MQDKVSNSNDSLTLEERLARVETALERLAGHIEATTPTPDAAEFLTQNEICELLKFSRTTLFFLRRNNDFPPPDIGGFRPRWKRATVEAWTEAKKGA